MVKIALCLIVKGSPEEAKLLDRCLSTVAPFVDGIFLTLTQPSKDVEKVAKKYGAQLSHFEWIYDFAAARNYNFSHVPKEYDYVLWCDADDAWRGLEKLRPTLDKYPTTEAFAFWYLYDWDEFKKPTVVHKKTMLVKNDGCVKWTGRLHEDLEPTRQIDVRLIEGIDRCHLSTAERAKENAQRNVDIASRELKANPDDPRSYWNLANSHLGVGDQKKAAAIFREFLQRSESDEEKYLAHMRLADTNRQQGNLNQAIEQLRIAIGLFPALPDAYFQLGHLYYEAHNWDKAEEYMLQGLVRRPKIHTMIVFNPRDYDYNPMMLLAKIYYQKNRPDLMLPMLKGCSKIYPQDKELKRLIKDGEKEYKAMEKALKAVQKLQDIKDKDKLKKEIEKLPVNIQSHPAVSALKNVNFIKKESSGRDLVIYCYHTTQVWNPETFKTEGVGGSEEAVINLAREWAKLGWNVTVYNNCGHKPITADGVTYHPFWEFNYRDKQDVVILWRSPRPLDYEINAPKIYVDLHDVIAEAEFTLKRLERLTKIFVKTKFHRSLFPNIPDEKVAIVPNGVDFSTLESDPPIEKDPYLIINTSSPDRSLDVLPKLFKEVKKQIPQARLQWCYGWDNFKSFYARDTKKLEWMKKTQKEMQEAGIEDLGRLSQSDVGKLYQRASIFAYPTEFAEISCISAIKAQAARCYPVATDFGALAETIEWGDRVHSTKTKDTWSKPYQFHFGLEDANAQALWVEMVVQALKRPDLGTFNPSRLINRYNWETVAKQWDATFRI